MNLTADQLAILKERLETSFVPHLPPLLDTTKPLDHQTTKNISRALSAFALQKLCGVDEITAAKVVVDDYDDNGLDAICYHQASKRLFLVQGKLKETEYFQQDEAMAFAKGVRDLLKQDYSLFNDNVRTRQNEIESALEECDEIVLVIAHSGEKISEHADAVMKQLIDERVEIDERITDHYDDYGPKEIVHDLLGERAVRAVDDFITLYGCVKVTDPRVTYFGQAKLCDLTALYSKYGNALLEQNIRYYLGYNASDVNRAILNTLSERPTQFFYLNNGITAVAHDIHPKGNKHAGGQKFKAMGLSIINGAQTLASATHFANSNPGADITGARVLLTLIRVRAGDTFGKDVTKARNHQNPVALANFAALDPNQERLRRELAFYDIEYHYRPESKKGGGPSNMIAIEEAATALALSSAAPDFAVIVKREPSKLLDVDGKEYGKLFYDGLPGRKLAIATRLYRKALQVLQGSENSASGMEKLFYRHGRNAIIWLLFQAHKEWLNNQVIPSDEEAGIIISTPLDTWRQKTWDQGKTDLASIDKGPLAFFRSLTYAKPFLISLRDGQ
jgi:hypothetical protein